MFGLFIYGNSINSYGNDGKESSCQQVLTFPSRDSVFDIPLLFCRDEDKKYYYYAPVRTTVCGDALCDLLDVKIYWDITGSYSHFDTLPGLPLTKTDHKPFSGDDYRKLHQVLADPYSVIGNMGRDDLVDYNKEQSAEEVDAFTGATNQSLENVVVDGALYSTYTLWHIIHGELKSKILQYTQKHLNDDMIKQLILSDEPRDVLIVLRKMDENDFMQFAPQLINLMGQGNSFINFYLAKKLPDRVWKVRENKKALDLIWHKLDERTKSVLK